MGNIPFSAIRLEFFHAFPPSMVPNDRLYAKINTLKFDRNTIKVKSIHRHSDGCKYALHHPYSSVVSTVRDVGKKDSYVGHVASGVKVYVVGHQEIVLKWDTQTKKLKTTTFDKPKDNVFYRINGVTASKHTATNWVKAMHHRSKNQRKEMLENGWWYDPNPTTSDGESLAYNFVFFEFTVQE